MRIARRPLGPPRKRTGREKRWLNARFGPFKRTERGLDRLVARYVFPYLTGMWSPYNWLLANRLEMAEATIEPARWPAGLPDLRLLVVTDIHTGAFVRPEVLADALAGLMAFSPDLVAVVGDVVEGTLEDLDGFLPSFGLLADAPLGAWFAFGNHDYYTREAAEIGARLRSVGVQPLRNESVILRHGDGAFVLGGIDDRLLGTPDWEALSRSNGPPHLLLAHHPDDFYEAAGRGTALVVSGHTHGGQIRLPKGPPIVRQSERCLDEGLYSHDETLLAVSRGLGAVGIPWRAGALPEALLLRVRSPRRPDGMHR